MRLRDLFGDDARIDPQGDAVDVTGLGERIVTPRSRSGAIHCSKTGRTARFPCIQIPRTRPVPLSELK